MTRQELRLVGATADDQIQRLERRAARERAARIEAERVLESKSLELFSVNRQLIHLNADLEARVAERTKDLDGARSLAVHALNTDPLTRIASRACYSDRIEEAVEKAGRGDIVLGLAMLDVDEFKMINDTLGHSYGDSLLVVLAERLRRSIRSTDMVARIGGDEFAVILEGPDSQSVMRNARRLLRVFKQPITADGVTFQCSASIGLALAPDHAQTTGDLQRFADLALYKAKREGKRGLATFNHSLLTAVEARQRMEADLRETMARDGFEIYFQPIVDLRTGLPRAAEALARWTDAQGNSISPEIFIPVAEECGLIRRLGKQLLRKSLRAGKRWIEAGLIQRISFNVSPVELLDRNFQRAVLSAIDEEEYPAELLSLEITEGVVLRSLKAARKVMLGLQSKGIRFGMDDFGSGYSNLSYLRDLPLNALKIDRKLLVNLEHDPASQAIVRNTVALCRDLGIRSVCEGVETKGQLDFLIKIGCDAAQGFLLYVPVPSDLPSV